MHQPVLYDEVLSALAIKPDGLYLDATFGRGGHARGVMARLGDAGHLMVIDRDLEAIQVANKMASEFPGRMTVYHGDFAGVMQHQLQDFHQRVDGILLDLGVSSPQLDQASRGFSFSQDGPLDMRMNQEDSQDAAMWLAQASSDEISRVLWEYGEERYAKRIARAIVEKRDMTPLTTTKDLVDLIVAATPRPDPHKHPATRTFQAIRCHINDEFEQVHQALHASDQLLAPGGRLSVITFHSIEDRICKHWMKDQVTDHSPSKLPIQAAEIVHRYQLVTRKPVLASEKEIDHNPRARSAKLRVIEKQ